MIFLKICNYKIILYIRQRYIRYRNRKITIYGHYNLLRFNLFGF